ncbi:MAG: glycosyltransferase [Methylococcales bacterium]|nr:glycosyltransferase [Methylococcales bacterium]
MIWTELTGLGLLAIWLLILAWPWQAWRVRETLAARSAPASPEQEQLAARLSIIIPARDEATTIGRTLAALNRQRLCCPVYLVDDNSSDGTAKVARQAGYPNLTLINGEPLPEGWTGKLWAQQQALPHVTTPLTLLIDADIELKPGIIEAMVSKLDNEQLDLVSLMARLNMSGFWEHLLIPAFIHFFKLVYPFAWANQPQSRMAAAAGGCILVKTEQLTAIGGFAALRNAIIDDCTLARRVKVQGGKTWLGLTHDVASHRSYTRLEEIWQMVARTAYSQLNYSPLLLALCTVAMLALYWSPLMLALLGQLSLAMVIYGCISLSYLPVLRYYQKSSLWALTLPPTALLYLAMTWSSAWRFWRGERSQWKGRRYSINS